MIGLPFDFPPGPRKSRRNYALRLPTALRNALYRRTWHRGVHICRAGVPKSAWHNVRHRQGMIALFSGRAAGEAQWIDRDGAANVQPLRAGDVWFVAPGVPHSCILHRKSEILMIFLERWRMKEWLRHCFARVEATGSVARLRSYFPVIPMLRGLNLVVHHQSKGLPVGEDGSSGPDPIDAALVFARDLWLMHYCELRTAVDGRQPEDVLRELGGGNGDGPSPAH